MPYLAFHTIISYLLLSSLSACHWDSDESGNVNSSLTEQDITSIQVSPVLKTYGLSSNRLPLGEQQKFVAIAYYDDTSEDITDSVTWQSDDEQVVSINHGVASGLALGNTHIFARLGTVTSNSIELTITESELVSIQVAPVHTQKGLAVAALPLGIEHEFIALGNYSDNSTVDISNKVIWQSADSENITIANGIAVGLSVGSTELNASHSGIVSNSFMLTITDSILTSIQVTAVDIDHGHFDTEIPLGVKHSYAAIGNYSDGSTFNITKQVAWRSSDAAVASIVGGVLSPHSFGTVGITANMDSITSNNFTLTVSSAVLTELQVTPVSANLAKGYSQNYTAVATYSDNSTADVSHFVTWYSSDSELAIIIDGVLTSVSVGSGSLSANLGDVISNNAEITITDAVITSLQVTPASTAIAKGYHQEYRAIANFSDQSTSDISNQVAWHSDDTQVAIIFAASAIGSAVGDTNISASFDNIISNTAQLMITDAVITSLQIAPAIASIAEGTTQVYSAIANFSDQSTLDITSDVAWHSDDISINTIVNGNATGGSVGSNTITASIDQIVSNNAQLTVTDAVITSIQITPSVATIAKGNMQNFTAIASYSDQSTLDVTSHVAWHSDDINIDTIVNGNATGGAVGSSIVTATIGNIASNNAQLTVTNAVLTSLQVTPPTSSIAKGSTETYIASGTYSDNSVVDITSSVDWHSDDISVATIITGIVTGVTVGNANISASLAGITSNNAQLSVTSAVLTSLQLTPSTSSIAKGTTETYIASGTYSDNSVVDITSSVDWHSDDISVATIITGVVTGVTIGNANISASLAGITSNNAQLSVTNAVLTSLQVTPLTSSIAKGTTETYIASGTYSDSTVVDITSSVDWHSDDISVATIITGVVTGVTVGNVNISASLGIITSNNALLTVTSAELTSLEISPTTNSIAKGTNQTYIASGTYSDNSVVDITSIVDWHSDDISVATILSGSATGVIDGSANISASQGGISSNNSILNIISHLPLCGVIGDTSKTSAMGACIKVAQGLGGSSLNKLFTSSPSVMALEALGYVQQNTTTNSGRSYGDTNSEDGFNGPDGGVFALIRQDGTGYDSVTAAGGQVDRYCQDLANISFANKSNWRRATSTEINDLYLSNGSMWSNYGWPTQYAYWSSSPHFPQFQFLFTWLRLNFTGNSNTGTPTYATCLSEL